MVFTMYTTYDLYSKPQYGKGLPVYAGVRRQSGGGILGAIARFALPVLKNVGRRALNVAAKTAKDFASGKRGVGEAIKRHAKKEAVSAVSDWTSSPQPPSAKNGDPLKRNGVRA